MRHRGGGTRRMLATGILGVGQYVIAVAGITSSSSARTNNNTPRAREQWNNNKLGEGVYANIENSPSTHGICASSAQRRHRAKHTRGIALQRGR